MKNKLRVEYGASQLKDGKWLPFIAIETPEGGRVEFIANKVCKDQAEAEMVCKSTYYALSVVEKENIFMEGAH